MYVKKIVPLITILGVLFAVHSVSSSPVSFDIPDLTTVPSIDTDQNGFNNNGIWFTVTTGSAQLVSDDSFPGFVDSQYQIRTQQYTSSNAAEFVVQGLFGNGNNVAAQGSGAFPTNPGYFSFGTEIGPNLFATANQFTALSGQFGNWNSSDSLRGALGLVFANGTDIHYGYADITVFSSGVTTLHGFAYESTPSTPITAVAVPEPSFYATFIGLLSLCLILNRRRKS
jgi:hypothetical protein